MEFLAGLINIVAFYYISRQSDCVTQGCSSAAKSHGICGKGPFSQTDAHRQLS